MDTLTHGLLGLTIGAIRRPDGTPTDRAALLAAVIAAELPDLDYLWPSDEPVLVTLRAHRGLSHALIAAPAVALVAAGISRLIFRRAAFLPIYAVAVAAVVFGHILCDLWTGWGTRIFLPFSDRRFGLDWTSVLDPLMTLPLVIGAGIALWRRRGEWRRPLLIALSVSMAYVGARAGVRVALEGRVDAHYGAGARVGALSGGDARAKWGREPIAVGRRSPLSRGRRADAPLRARYRRGRADDVGAPGSRRIAPGGNGAFMALR